MFLIISIQLKLCLHRIDNLAKNTVAVFVIHINFNGVAIIHKRRSPTPAMSAFLRFLKGYAKAWE
ncbi:hypothetical protein [Moraxella lacunata]|uniref:hypothetical protein n=1 Tax=Moraxella lacunata TaxID=477 RepID=UPI003EDF9753